MVSHVILPDFHKICCVDHRGARGQRDFLLRDGLKCVGNDGCPGKCLEYERVCICCVGDTLGMCVFVMVLEGERIFK